MKIFRIFLIFICFLLVAYLFVLDFVPGDSMVIRYDFCKSEPMITPLSPGDRLWPIVKDADDCYQSVAKSPVYFDVRVPQVFDEAILKVTYLNENGEEFAIGPQTVKNEWLWLLKDIKAVNSTYNGWLEGEAKYDLRGVYQASSVMRWLISAPNVEENKNVIIISKIEIMYLKDPLKFSNLFEQIKNWLRKIVR